MQNSRARINTAEQKRLGECSSGSVPLWQKWGPYVADRSWGTVREDYSENGDSWNHFPHDMARKRAYRWGEDALAGICDRYQVLVFGPAFWNERDPILKERLFGLSAWEGNHGEDVKECYYYLDNTPTHSYMKYLYKYPHAAFPYEQLKNENQHRDTRLPEYELVDTGVFSENRYFDITIEYAKKDAEDICIRFTVINRGPDPESLHILPQLWFRNQWSWKDSELPKPEIIGKKGQASMALMADDEKLEPLENLSFPYRLGKRYLYGPKDCRALFTHNESRWDESVIHTKDAFHRAVIHKENCSIPEARGTKAALHYYFDKIPSGKSVTLTLRLTDKAEDNPLDGMDQVFDMRIAEAEAFYETVYPPSATDDEKKIQRQAIAGVLWSKQCYLFDVNVWLKGDHHHVRPPEARYFIRNLHWNHLNSMRILLMPDKWEYPWFAAWDQAFHCLILGLVDLKLAKEELWILLFDQFQHPNGQIPSYEWEFSDLNPPVQAWAILELCKQEKEQTGEVDLFYLERCYHKLLINFAWWVNKVDSEGHNVFEGGFLGLDNITVLDRSVKLPGGSKLQQSDGTGWMALFCLNLMRIALLLSEKDRVYESLATKFFQHFVYIAHAMKIRGNRHYELWSDTDGFFYDVMTFPNGSYAKFRVRSLVGIIPLYAVELITEEDLKRCPEFAENFRWFLKNRKDLVFSCLMDVSKENQKRYLLSLVNEKQLKRIFEYIWNPKEFRAEYGLRSLSKHHQEHPFVFEDKQVGYEPGESLFKVKGGNSNWRGPVWFPTTYVLIESMKKFSQAFGSELKISETGEESIDLEEMAKKYADKLISIFAKDRHEHRPFLGEEFPFKDDPAWRDHILFYEYFNPETGKGFGASHQTGWSALVANLIHEFRGTKK